MNRRELFKLFGGVAVTALAPLQRATRRGRIVVAGGGIIGSSIAYHLARRGAQVTLLEKDRPASGATRNSFAWINASFSKQPRHYFELNRLGVEAYRHLDPALAARLQIQWGGSLEWVGDAGRAQSLRRQVRGHQEWGYATHLVDEAGFKQLEKNIRPGPIRAACHSEYEGSVDPTRAVEAYLEQARNLGVEIRYPSEITGIEIRQGRLAGVQTVQGDLAADVLIIAAGVDTPRLAAKAGIQVPLKDSPGILAQTKPLPELINRVVLAPGAHMKQNPDGRIVTGVGFGGEPGTDTSRQKGVRILKEAEKFLPDLGNAALDKVSLGWRPLPKDDHPIVGFTDKSLDVYIAVMHSGVTLSAIIGRLAALEILDGVQVDLLRHYRLSRFQP